MLHLDDDGRGPPLVLLHGWPDSPRVWDGLGPRLVDAGYRVIRVYLPGFHGSPETHGAPFPVLAERLRDTLDELGLERVPLIGHDWGAYLSYVFEKAYPERVDRFVTMDVGGHITVANPLVGFAIASYQAWNISAWFWGHLLPGLGSWMTRFMAGRLKAPRPETVPWSANYPYFYTWKAMLSFRDPLQDYAPKRPVLYFFGERKPFHFHSERWLTLATRVVPVPGAAHWLMLDDEDLVYQEIREWLTAAH